MQTKKNSLTKQLGLMLVRIARVYVNSPVLSGLATLFALFCLFAGAYVVGFTYVVSIYFVHYLNHYNTYENLYYDCDAYSETKKHYSQASEVAGWGAFLSAALGVASVFLMVGYYKGSLMGHNWLLCIPVLLIMFYDWVVALPEKPRKSLVERARAFLNDADEKLNRSQGD